MNGRSFRVVFLAMMEEWAWRKMLCFGTDNACAGETVEVPSAQSYALLDPCASRYYPELQESVRHLADAVITGKSAV